MPHNNHLRLIFFFFVILLIALLSKIFGWQNYFNLESLQTLFQKNMAYSILAFIVAFTLGNFLNVPGFLFLASSILLLGQLKGYLLTLTAAFISSALYYPLTDFLAGNSFRSIDRPLAKKWFQRLDKNPLLANIVLRLLFQTAPHINYFLALSRPPLKYYLGGILLGLPLPIFIYTFFIDQIVRYFL